MSLLLLFNQNTSTPVVPTTSGYSYYINTYLGNSITEVDFPRLYKRAQAIINMLTFRRAADVTDAPTLDLINMATCAVAEAIQETEMNGGMDGITSEGIGSSRVSYAPYSAASRKNTQKYSQAAGIYLASTGLMYRGFASDEYSAQTDIPANDILI